MQDIINQYRGKIRAIIKKMTGSYNEDIEQEVYIKTYLNIDKYKEQNKFSQWICTIAANLCRDYLRSSKFKISQNLISDDEILSNIIEYDIIPMLKEYWFDNEDKFNKQAEKLGNALS